jgi:hypothetical protein
MIRLHRTSTAVMFLLCVGAGAAAAQTATQTFQTQLDVVHAISVSGTPSTMRILAATPGTGLTSITDATSTYAITTNDTATTGTGVVITAAITSGGALPTGETLTLALQAPGGGGTSAGAVTLTTSAQNVVTGITPQNASGRTITYVYSATVSAAPRNAVSRTVTLTLATGS